MFLIFIKSLKIFFLPVSKTDLETRSCRITKIKKMVGPSRFLCSYSFVLIFSSIRQIILRNFVIWSSASVIHHLVIEFRLVVHHVFCSLPANINRRRMHRYEQVVLNNNYRYEVWSDCYYSTQISQQTTFQNAECAIWYDPGERWTEH